MKIDKNGLCLALTLMLSSLGFGYDGMWTQDGVTFSYDVSDGEACVSITSCGDSATVVIPSEIDGYKVTSIGETSSGCRTRLASVVISDGVTSIGGSAFSWCSGLTSVTIPDGVTSIGECAFAGCSSLTSVTIPSSVTSIGDGAFYGCSGLTSVTIPDGVTSIGWGTFEGCAALTSITIPNSVTRIDKYAFYDCSGLTTVTIPNSVTSIERNAFEGCSRLTSVTIPNRVTRIEWRVFSGCTSLRSVTIPNSVTTIGSEAFAECGLSAVSVSARTEIDESAFDSGVIITRRPAEVIPSVDGDEGATVTGDAETGFVITPSKGKEAVVVTIPSGVDAAKVTVKVSPETKKVTPNGAAVRVLRGEADITDFLDIPAADSSGVIDLNAATVKEEIVKAILSVEDGAEIKMSAENPTLTTADTKPGLKYQLYEGATLSDLKAGDSTVGDGSPWTPKITEKGGSSGFYTIQVTK